LSTRRRRRHHECHDKRGEREGAQRSALRIGSVTPRPNVRHGA
jgi:hypothetical protein